MQALQKAHPSPRNQSGSAFLHANTHKHTQTHRHTYTIAAAHLHCKEAGTDASDSARRAAAKGGRGALEGTVAEPVALPTSCNSASSP
eukprot:1145568-Pelagomonas_calceolata.AAC.3